MPERKPSLRLRYKDSFLSPTTPTPAGSLGPAERWCEVVATPLAREAFERAFGEYAANLTPDMQVPGIAAWKLVGAREALNLLMTLGEPVKPHLPVDAAKKLDPV